MKKQTGRDRLIKKYGIEILNEAVAYFERINKHCIMSELNNRCEIIKRGLIK